jgi:hypothetical protein
LITQLPLNVVVVAVYGTLPSSDVARTTAPSAGAPSGPKTLPDRIVMASSPGALADGSGLGEGGVHIASGMGPERSGAFAQAAKIAAPKIPI